MLVAGCAAAVGVGGQLNSLVQPCGFGETQVVRLGGRHSPPQLSNLDGTVLNYLSLTGKINEMR